MCGGKVFLEEKFQSVGHWLDEPEHVEIFFKAEQREWDANAVRADAVLDDRRKAALEVHRKRHQWQHHDEGERDDLSEDDRELKNDVRHCVSGTRLAVD
jgi:hypothetical protein